MRIFTLLVASLALLFASCQSTLPEPTPEIQHLSLDVTGIVDIEASGGELRVGYTITDPVAGITLEVTSPESWIGEIEVATEVSFTVLANHTTDERIGYLTFTYGAETQTVAVRQAAGEAGGELSFELRETKVAVGSKGGTHTLAYTLLGDDTTLLPTITSNKEWVTIGTITSTEAEIIVERNHDTRTRNAKLTLEYLGTELAVYVDQAAASTEVTLIADNQTVKGGEQVTFTVIYEEEDVTSEATIYADDNTAISNPYTATDSGEKVFYAIYKELKSKPCTVVVIPAYAPEFPADSNPESFAFNQRMLIVDHTGQGCSYCPGVKQAIHDTQEKEAYKDKFNVVYAYTFSSNEICYSSAARTLWNYYVGVCSTGDKLTGYPSFTTNYCFNYTGKYDLESRINTLWDANPAASIAYAAKIEGDKIVVSASVKSSVSQQYKLSLWVLENDIYAKQTAATADWMNTHSSVMRDAPTGVTNTDIAGIDFGYVEAGTTLSRILEFDLFCASAWKRENLSLIAILSAPSEQYGGKYEVVTTQMCAFGAEAGFDYKK